MAIALPSNEEWAQHDEFINAAELALVPRKPVRRHSIASMLDVMRPSTLSVGMHQAKVDPRLEPVTLAEMYLPNQPPFECAEVLPIERAARIAMLHQWLERLPAQQWLRQQKPVLDALESLSFLRRRRDCAIALRDDLSEWRFWRFAGHVARASRARRFSPQMLNPPDADQRRRAAEAADEIVRIAGATTLLMSAGVEYRHRENLLAGLRAIQAHVHTARRKRMDSHEKEREFIRSATYFAHRYMGYASTEIVRSIVCLHLKEKAASDGVVKLIREEKRQLEAEARG